MYTLYYGPGSCSMAIHVALLECNQQVTLKKVDLMSGEQRQPEYLKINSRGQVPVLVDGDQTLREGAAILLHVLEKHQSPLMPKNGVERDKAIEWLMFCNATLHPAYSRGFFLKKAGADGAKLLETAITNINALWQDVEQTLGKQPYLCGEQVTMADILMSVIANWSGNISPAITIGPNTKKMIRNIIARPAFKKALESEHVEYKAAA